LTTALDVFVGLSWFINIILDIGAAYYCYRLTRITGGFRAWWLVIIFTILFAVQSFSGVSYQVLTGASASSQTGLFGSALFSVVLGLLMSALLFSAMFGIFRTFKRVQSADAKQT
jgi:succinate dehydrogenase/fumarate reductase cytochrome b subunit